MIVAGGIDTGIVIGVENRKEYKVMNDRYNDVQLEDILNERITDVYFTYGTKRSANNGLSC